MLTEQRDIDDADAGPSIGRSMATGFNNLVDRIPIIGERLPNLKTDYTRAEQNLLSKTTPFKTGSRTKTGAVNRRGGGEARAEAQIPTPLAVDPTEQIEEEVGTSTVTDIPSLADIQSDSYTNTLNDLTGGGTGTGGDESYDAYDPATETESGLTTTAQAIRALYDPNYNPKFKFRGRGNRRGGFRKAFSRKYF